MRIQCPNCSGINAIEESDLGQSVECGHCESPMQIPFEKFAPGVLVGEDFIIEDKLGQGGMGVVYKAYQISLDRSVALKILMLDLVKEESIIDFVREARASARLNHQNIVQAYAVGNADGIYYLAMELVDGQTLKEIMDETRAPLSVEDSLDIMIQMSEALSYAWKTQELVHRDLKPDNIMLMADNCTAKLMDMGLSRFANDKLAVEDDGDEIMGTPQYICPEQLIGDDMDFRGDQYSLGATFYHLIANEFPFMGPNVAEIARMHLQDPLQPPTIHVPTIPQEICNIIHRMMAKTPGERYQSMDELVVALRETKELLKNSGATNSATGKFKLRVRSKGINEEPKGGRRARRPVNSEQRSARHRGGTSQVTDLKTKASATNSGALQALAAISAIATIAIAFLAFNAK